MTLASTNGVAWSYDRRYRDSAQIHGLISFFNERVDLRVDGVLHTRPVTPWSRPDSPGGAGPGAGMDGGPGAL